MATHVSQCMAKASMCVTHGMSCVNMHATFEAYIYGAPIQFVERSKGGRRRRNGKEEGRKGEEKGRKGKEKARKRKEKERRKKRKKGEEERKKKEKKEGVLRSEHTRKAKNPELRYKR